LIQSESDKDEIKGRDNRIAMVGERSDSTAKNALVDRE
jgi:hypothetical protein